MKTLFLIPVLLLTAGIWAAGARPGPLLADTTQAHRWYTLAMGWQNKGQEKRAHELFAQAAVFFRQHRQWGRQLDCHNQMAWSLLHMGKYEEALQQARWVIRESKARLGPDNAQEGMACWVIGRIYQEKGGYEQALEYHRQALQIRLKVLGPGHPQVGASYYVIGSIYLGKGEYDKALENFRQSLEARLQVKGEVDPEVAITYHNIGNIYDRKGEYDKSLEYYRKAFQLWQQTQGKAPEKLATSYLNIGGGLYYKNKEYDKALVYYQQALQIRRQNFGEVHEDVADTYLYIGRVYDKKLEYDQALACYQKALEIRQQLLGSGHTKIADCYYGMGKAYRAKGELDKALECHRKALEIRRKFLGKNHPQVANSSNLIGQIYQQSGEHPQALRHFQQAILANIPAFQDTAIARNPVLTHQAGSYLEGNALFTSLQFKAESLQKLFKQSQALADLQLAYQTYCSLDTLARQIQNAYAEEKDQVAFTSKAMVVYQQALPLCLQLHALTHEPAYLNQAFSFAERGKASVLLSTLAESKARTFAGIPDSLLQQDQSLRTEIARCAQQIARELARGEELDSSKLIGYQGRLFALKRQQESLVNGLEKDFPDYFSLKYQRATISPAQLQKVLNDKTAVVEYVLADTLLYQFTITRKSFAAKTIPLDRSFRRQVMAFREAIEIQDEDLYRLVGDQLYRDLIPPSLPRSIRELILIPGGKLATLPFEALPSRQPKKARAGKSKDYLGHQYAVSYAYSARLLYERFTQPVATGRPQLLALAPVFADTLTNAPVASRRASHPAGRGVDEPTGWNRDSTGLASKAPAQEAGNRRGDEAPNWLVDSQYVAPLPASRREVETIAHLFRARGAGARVYLDGQAREEEIKQQDLSGYRYLHLATHGFVNERYPELSGLLLAQDKGLGEDGILYTGEIYNLRLQADLVTLSACETGLGKIAPGEGMIGLTRALLYAGARNIMVSLWKVSDVSTADLMKYFYQALLRGEGNSQALQAAKKKMVRQGRYAQPYFWAPFILVGH